MPLSVRDVNFVDAGTGAIRKLLFLTGFDLPHLFVTDRPKAETFAAFMRRKRIDAARGFDMWTYTGFSPLNVPNYYSQMRDYFAWSMDRGLYIHGPRFCDQSVNAWVGPGGRILLSRSDQDRHIDQIHEGLVSAGAQRHHLGEICNEAWMPDGSKNFDGGVSDNRFPASRFTGFLYTRTSDDGITAASAGPYLDYQCFHSNRGQYFLVDSIKDPFEAARGNAGEPGYNSHKPTGEDEGDKFIEHTPEDCRTMGYGASLMSAYFTIHSDTELQMCNVSPELEARIDAFTEAWHSGWCPDDALEHGVYGHGGAGSHLAYVPRYPDSGGENPSGVREIFSLTLGQNDYEILCYPGPAFVPQAIDGYQIVERFGTTALRLERP